MHTTIGVIGGTGALGGGLVRRLARAGFSTNIGSRMADKAALLAAEISNEIDGTAIICGLSNRDAAEASDVVVVTVPFASQVTILDEIATVVAGKIVIDTTVPLVPPKVARVQLPQEGSAAAVARAHLGEDVRLVTAFHNVSAEKLNQIGEIDCDVLVFGDDKSARASVVGLISALGLRGVHGGPLDNSVAAEALTSVLIAVNRLYKIPGGAGIKITGEFTVAPED